MPELIPILTEREIDKLVDALVRRISDDYRDKSLVVIGVLKGAFIFLSDLVRRLKIPVEIDFIQVSSYAANKDSTGEVSFKTAISTDITDKEVLIVEDIIDTGLTIVELIDYLKSFHPKRIKVCAFIDKTERRSKECKIDYTGHTVGEGFLVGYGLDYAEQYRNLPAIYHLKF